MLFAYNYTTTASVRHKITLRERHFLLKMCLFTLHIRRKSAQIMLLLFANITLFCTPLGTGGRMSVAERGVTLNTASELSATIGLSADYIVLLDV